MRFEDRERKRRGVFNNSSSAPNSSNANELIDNNQYAPQM